MANTDVSMGIDFGGTFIKGGLCDAAGALVAPLESIPTEADRGFDHSFAQITTLIDRLMQLGTAARLRVAAVGIGAPGPMSHATGTIHDAPNLPGWMNIPLKELLEQHCKLPVIVENDANAAAYGEFVRLVVSKSGQIAAVENLVLLTLGTGIGGGVILKGRLWRGSFDNAGEIGHTIVVPNGAPCPCGQRGCLERYASANAITSRYAKTRTGAERAARLRIPEIEQSQAIKREERELAGAAAVAAAARGGDTGAIEIWSSACEYLAIAVVNLQHTFNPQIVLLAGGLSAAGEQLLRPVREAFERQSWRIAPDHPRIELAQLGGTAGTIGAAMLATRAET
jgi:glucokinase